MNHLINRTERLREIETLLFRNSSGLSVPEIAALCGVDRRTIYRDLDLLSEAQVPIWQDSGRYGIIRDQYLATIRLKFNEAVALYIAARLLARHADEHNPHIVAALTKLAVAFPDPLSGYLVCTAQVNESLPVNSSFLAVLETVASCWAAHCKVRLWYPSQQTQLLSDGTLHFQVDVADLREMQPWIRSWGADVEVLAPESLRAEMVDQARELAQIYLI